MGYLQHYVPVAIIISMLTIVLPWGPIMAFITSSPLMSPDLFVMLSEIIGIKFAIVLTISSVLIGIAAGYISYYLEKYTSFFDNQVRLSNKEMQDESQNNSTCCTSKKSAGAKKILSAKLPKTIKLRTNCCSVDSPQIIIFFQFH